MRIMRSRLLFSFAAAVAWLLVAGGPALADDGPQAYATFVTDATAQHGLFTIWHKGGHVYLELRADQLDRDYVETVAPGNGLGGWFVEWGNTDYLPAEIVRFTRAGDKIAMLWPNPNFVAQPGSAASRSIEQSVPHSVVGLAQVVAQNAQSGAVVIDASPFLGDMLDLHDILKESLPTDPGGEYQLNAERSYIGVTKAFPRNIVIEAQQDWSTDTPSVVDVAPDNRNLQMRVVYNIAEPPGDTDYRPRYADDRVGIYDDIYLDFGNDTARERQLRYLIRWNIQPSDPSKRMSPAKHPMVFYLSNTIPEAYRPAVRRGVLMWNQAFEKLGISDALQVRDQPNDPDWDADDIRYNVIRWVSDVRANYGADSQTLYDPRTGQEFRTGILVADNTGLGPRLNWKYFVDPVRYGRVTDPVPQWFIDDAIISTILHETGHDLGMQHNFIGSAAYTARELQDPSFTARYGITSTVMEYAPLNLWPKQYGQGAYYEDVLGPYDYFAMKYAYAPIPGAATPEDERPTLERWAAAWSDPRYRYGSDEDVSWGDGHAADPRIETGDLTNDPLSWCQTQIGIAQGLLKSLNGLFPQQGEAFEEERAAFVRDEGRIASCATIASHFIGGQYLSRAHRGDPGAQPPIVPVPRSEQQRAFALMDRYAFGPDAWSSTPSVLANLGYSEWAGYGYTTIVGFGNIPAWAYNPPPQHYESMTGIAGATQHALIAQMFNPAVLQRLADAPTISGGSATATLTDLFSWMHAAVFGELDRQRPSISLLRRGLQQDYEQTLIGLATAPEKGTPADAVALARAELSRVAGACTAMLSSRSMDSVTRAHVMLLRARAQSAVKV